jgi:hypothetical protein
VIPQEQVNEMNKGNRNIQNYASSRSQSPLGYGLTKNDQFEWYLKKTSFKNSYDLITIQPGISF